MVPKVIPLSIVGRIALSRLETATSQTAAPDPPYVLKPTEPAPRRTLKPRYPQTVLKPHGLIPNTPESRGRGADRWLWLLEIVVGLALFVTLAWSVALVWWAVVR
jgi:hypothetical protein